MSGNNAGGAGVAAEPAKANDGGGANKASDDLLQLSGANPFASVLNANASSGNSAAFGASSSSAFGGAGSGASAFPENNANGKMNSKTFLVVR